MIIADGGHKRRPSLSSSGRVDLSAVSNQRVYAFDMPVRRSPMKRRRALSMMALARSQQLVDI